ncbi:MAG: hypothetical protein NVS4B8_25650 [Herpetosiphon sp.]
MLLQAVLPKQELDATTLIGLLQYIQDQNYAAYRSHRRHNRHRFDSS